MKFDQQTLPDKLSQIPDKKGYSEPDLLSDSKPPRPDSGEMKTTIIEPVTWQWLYDTNLLIAFELVLNTIDTSLCSNPHSGITVKVAAAVASLLKSDWNPDSPTFNSMETRGVSQDHPFAITTMMPGSGHNQQPNPSSESSGQEAPKALSQPIGYFTSLLYSDSGGNNGVPEQQPHTLGLNCFVHLCHGACQFRQSSGLSDSRAPDCEESSKGPTVATPGQNSCPHLTNRYCSICKPVNGVALDSMVVGTIDKNVPAGQAICNLIIFGEDGQLLQCGKVLKDAKSLSRHIGNSHSGQKICDLTVVGEDSQPQPCGSVCKNAQALQNHKRRDHTTQQTCDVPVIGRDGLQRPCGSVCRNAAALATHKSGQHTGKKTCDVTVIGEGGQPRPCGKACRNAAYLYIHKSGQHTGLKTCNVTVIGEDDQSRPCGKTCKNVQALTNHKNRDHTGQQTCDVTVVRKDGQPQPCGKIFRNAKALLEHKSGYHTGQQTCDVTVVGEEGQQQPCGKVCKNAKALSNHKRMHRKRKPSEQ